MKTDLFKFIDESIELLNNYNDILEKISKKTTDVLKNELYQDDNFLNITYRIKSKNSLREKIIKNNFYLEYSTVDQMILNLSDLIGIRIECRFLKEEELVFKKIKEKFRFFVGDGFYKIEETSPIKLKLSDKQPQIQKNGFEIYKIDGCYEYGKNRFNFELQIKSMVNVFWGEIDHKILYKNYNYMINEGFFKDIMASIKGSLYMVDRQLMILYDHVSSLDASAVVSANSQLNYLLSKILHDVFSQKVKEDFGFVFNFKNSTDIIVEFLQLKAAKDKELSYGENFVTLINKINEINYKEINLQDRLVLNKHMIFVDDFTESLANSIISILNRDFHWNLILKIINQIEGNSFEESLEDLLNFIRAKYSFAFLKNFETFKFATEEMERFEDSILKIIAEKFKKNYSLSFIAVDAITEIDLAFEEILVETEERKSDINYVYRVVKDRLERI